MKWRELARLVVGSILFAGVGGLWGYAAQGFFAEPAPARLEQGEVKHVEPAPQAG